MPKKLSINDICHFYPNQYQEEALPTIAESAPREGGSRTLQSSNSKNRSGPMAFLYLLIK
jgi:hypothetical protein